MIDRKCMITGGVWAFGPPPGQARRRPRSQPTDQCTQYGASASRNSVGSNACAGAGTVGYSSEYAFAAAFKRAPGVAPGRYRACVAPADGIVGTLLT